MFKVVVVIVYFFINPVFFITPVVCITSVIVTPVFFSTPVLIALLQQRGLLRFVALVLAILQVEAAGAHSRRRRLRLLLHLRNGRLELAHHVRTLDLKLSQAHDTVAVGVERLEERRFGRTFTLAPPCHRGLLIANLLLLLHREVAMRVDRHGHLLRLVQGSSVAPARLRGQRQLREAEHRRSEAELDGCHGCCCCCCCCCTLRRTAVSRKITEWLSPPKS
mmetsp:Transcript_98462/g.246716  ORF Transcript_98462/g.246716 Transcript_98462/m.246716 type:complete len:221 (+) Transcript_98462:288-950(+)